MLETQTTLELWGALLLGSLLIAGGIYLYRLIWQERYRRPNDFGKRTIRLRGRVTAPGEAGSVVYCTRSDGSELLGVPFMVAHRSGSQEVLARGAVLAAPRLRTTAGFLRCLRVGQKVTLDAISTLIEEPASLYRQAGRREILEAVRISTGCWPELRWLRSVLALSGLVALLSLGQVLFALRPDPRPLRGSQATAMLMALQPLRETTPGIRLQLLEPREGLLAEQVAMDLLSREELGPSRTLWVSAP